MMKLVSSLESVIEAIEVLNEALPTHKGLANRLGQAHAFYVSDHAGEEPKFGFSKFVGYENLTPAQYLKLYKSLNGRNTEHVLTKWFEEVREGSPTYRRLYEELRQWMAAYGARPRGGAQQHLRIMILKPEFQKLADSAGDDRRVLDLMIAVADLLTTKQRHELRAAL